MENLKKHLLSVQAEGNPLEVHVAKWILEKSEGYEQIESVFEDLTHGCQSGIVSHLVYYSDTTDFYNEFEEQIWELLEEQAEEFGSANALELISSLNGAKDVANHVQFKNLLAWYAFENTAYQIQQEVEQETV